MIIVGISVVSNIMYSRIRSVAANVMIRDTCKRIIVVI